MATARLLGKRWKDGRHAGTTSCAHTNLLQMAGQAWFRRQVWDGQFVRRVRAIVLPNMQCNAILDMMEGKCVKVAMTRFQVTDISYDDKPSTDSTVPLQASRQNAWLCVNSAVAVREKKRDDAEAMIGKMNVSRDSSNVW